MKTIVIAKSIKGRLVTKPKPPALPPSSPEVSRFDMNGKDSMVDGHQVIGINGSIDPQNFDDHPKLTIQDTVTGHSLTHFLTSLPLYLSFVPFFTSTISLCLYI